jgi:peptidoglycan/LPS O-acetylase OafA/YrhL
MKRFYELDLLRFIAAFSVLLFHYSFRGHAADNLSDLDYAWLAPVTKYGYLGVDLFFLISGFVILMTASSGSVKQFMVSRITRLYPAFWVSCTASFIVMSLLPQRRAMVTLPQFGANLTMVSGFAGIPFVDNVYWSLLVEMKFYFLVFVVLLARQIGRARQLLGLWLIGHLVTTLWPVKVLTSLFIPEFAPYFIAGAMFFLVSREGLDFYKGFILAVCYGLIAVQASHNMAELGAKYHTHYSSVGVALVLALFFAVFFLISTGRTARLGSARWVALGALTYPLYLIHQNIGFSLFNIGFAHINGHVLFWSVVALMLLAAWGVHQVEKRTARPMKELLLRVLGPREKEHEKVRASSG